MFDKSLTKKYNLNRIEGSLIMILKWLGILSGGILIIIGSYAIIHPEITLLSLILNVGIVLLVIGIYNIITYFQQKKEKVASGWILIDAIISIILPIFLISNYFITANIIPFIFSMGILFLGIQRIGLALDIKKLHSPYWKIMLIIGIIAIIFSIITLIKPIIATLAISMVIGIILIFYGIMCINASISISNLYRYFKD